MISCDFNGRIGNNMFQIAAALSLAKSLGEDTIFPLTTWAGHRGVRPVDLSPFGYKFNRGVAEGNAKYSDSDSGYSPIPKKKNTTLCGFYQSWQYFDDIKNELVSTYFTPSKEVKEKLNQYTISDNSLGISVRRGDYLMLQDNHCVLSAEYYQTAINEYFSDVDQVFVFSDDYDWCRETFGDQVEYPEKSVGVQLHLMVRMKNLILSNSTFAWWGGYLNTNGGKIVMPDPWYGPNYSGREKGLIYPGWIQHKHKITISPFRVDEKMYD